MNTNTIFGFVVGVAAGIGGTLLFDYITNKEEVIEELEEIEDVGETEVVEVNPPCRILAYEKPEIEDVVAYDKYVDLTTTYSGSVEGYKLPKELIDSLITDANDIEIQIDGEKLAESVNDRNGESFNIFDSAEQVGEDEINTFDKNSSIPPAFKNTPIVGKHDIQEISQAQYREEALDYSKQSCTYFINEKILVDAENLDELDIETTVGQKILEQLENEGGLYAFVSNISTEVDYEIVVEDRDRYEEVLEQYNKGDGDEECQNETS